MPGDPLWLGCRSQKYGVMYYFPRNLRIFYSFPLCAVLDGICALSCSVLGRILPACALGIVTVVHGGVLWSAGIAFCENVKNAIFRHLKFFLTHVRFMLR